MQTGMVDDEGGCTFRWIDNEVYRLYKVQCYRVWYAVASSLQQRVASR